MFDIGFGASEVQPHEVPVDHWCKSGHTATETWVHPVSGDDHPRRFFHVSGPKLDRSRHGIYCEWCLAISHQKARARPKGTNK